MSHLVEGLILLCLFGLLVRPSKQDEYKENWDNENPGLKYRDEYKSVNEYLVDKVDRSEPMSANIDSLVARMSSPKVKRQEKVVLNKLIALKNTEGNCDEISYKILMDNDKGTERKSRDVASKKSAPRRIDKIVNFYAVQHAISCQDKIESQLKQKLEQVDQDVLHRLSTWLDPMIDYITAKFQPPKGLTIGDDFSTKVYYSIINGSISDAVSCSPSLSYGAIKTLVQNNPDEEQYLHYYSNERTGERKFHENEVRKLAKKYLDGACEVYIGQVGELFERANFDSIFHHDIKSNDPHFYQAWAYNKICTDIYVTKKSRSWMHINLLSYAESKADLEEKQED